MEKKVQIFASIAEDLSNQIKEEAQRDSRTFSQMVAILLQQAIKEKTRKRAK
jgi:hypothetical protein